MAASTPLQLPAATPTNAEGGINVTKAEAEQLFDFIDTAGKGYISHIDLKTRLSIFFPDVPATEIKFLMNDKTKLTKKELVELLTHNEVTGFDPAAEAFKVVDPTNSGLADLDAVKALFERMGFSNLSKDDMDILLEVADADGDGFVSMDDWRALLTAEREEAQQQTLDQARARALARPKPASATSGQPAK